MIVKNIVSPCWLASRELVVAAARQAAGVVFAAAEGTELFFRADDLGVPGEKCRRMMRMFREARIPLHVAVTPAWLTEARWATLDEWAGDGKYFVWHQHGWRHQNHQLTGKKGEFGTDRTSQAKKADLKKGRDKLRSIMGDAFQPIFTPPWNRIDGETCVALAELGFTAVSRWQGENRKVPLPDGLPDIPVNVDLHTRGEADPAEGLAVLVDQFREAATTGRVGVMLHHQRMNDAAFDFLETFLKEGASFPHELLINLSGL